MLSLLIVYLVLALGVSFLCSLLEASLLSIPPGHVRLLVERGSPSGPHLERMKQNIDRPLAAILTLNTIAHTIGAAGVGAEAAQIWGHAWVGLTSAVLTLLILVLSEIIPKTLGAVHAKALAGFTAHGIRWLIGITLPIVLACEWTSRWVGGRRVQHHMARDEVGSMALLGRESGVLSEQEYRVIQNALALRTVRVKDIMTPRSVVFFLDPDATVADTMRADRVPPFARIPLCRGSLDKPEGIIHRYQIFAAARDGRGRDRLGELSMPAHVVPETSNVATLLGEFVQRQEQMFLVADEHGGIEGVVTLEDALETLLGVEIVDETDTTIDMRKLAERLKRRREPAAR